MVSNGKNMKDKFNSLGEIRGKSKSEIIENFGECTTDIRVNDTTICKWGKGNYVITLTFDINDKVISVTERTDTFWGQ
jgi:hypothetical protein